MSNSMRWRYGETNPVMLTVPEGTSVEIGDLVYLESGFAYPAGDLTDQGSLANNQQFLHDNFVGVAMQCATAASAETIRIATSGVFEFLSEPAAFDLGELIGGAPDSSGNQLESQKVLTASAATHAVGRCVKQVPDGSEKVLVDIVSTVVRGGPQAAAA